MGDLLHPTPQGLYCPAGDFHIDPSAPVPRAVITHAHADHLRPGAGRYLLAEEAAPLARQRLADDAVLETLAWGAAQELGDVRISLHPSGHIRGAAQVRIDDGGEVWVIGGDYKRAADPTAASFEPLACDTFISEATFALPVFRWPETATVIDELYEWWQANAAAGCTSVLACYALGKAQRVLAELARHTDTPVLTHGAVENMTSTYRQHGVAMLPTIPVTEAEPERLPEALVLAPPAALGSAWMKRFRKRRTAFCSGWMRIRGNRRRRNVDRGFVLSDHADWPALLATVRETGARRVLTTHGYADRLARYLAGTGLDADVLDAAGGTH